MGLLKVSQDYLLDTETLKFKHNSGDNELELGIPFYAWEYGDSLKRVSVEQEPFPSLVRNRVDIIKLNDLAIEPYIENQRIRSAFDLEPFPKDGRRVVISFSINGEDHTVTVKNSSKDSTITKKFSDGKKRALRDLCCEWHHTMPQGCDNGCERYPCVQRNFWIPLPGLVHPRTTNFFWSMAHFGLTPVEYNIFYQSKCIHKSLAYLLGSCAVLLHSDLSFDSIVTLCGADKTTLVVKKFIYTANRNVLKKLVFMKQE